MLLPVVLLLSLNARAQSISNYVANGSFEEVYSCNGPQYPLWTAKNWLSIDSASFGGGYISTCNSRVPLNGNTYQYPRTGTAHIISTMYYPNNRRGYLKNRLRSILQAGKTYCVKFYVNIANTSTYGMDGFGAYFGDNSIDTITKCNVPLVYLHPQVQNPFGNVIIDTLSWVPVTGTFVAIGTEKYMLIGNFLSEQNIDTVRINPTFLPLKFTDVCIDDVSCIDKDLPAYAGPDQPVIAGNSVYIGRERDFAVDEACTWYQLPDMVTPIATGSGILVSPVATATYVVKQEIDCGTLKMDTVVVYMDAVGVQELKNENVKFDVFPNPVQNQLHVTFINLYKNDFTSAVIYNNQGQQVYTEDFESAATVSLSTNTLPDGVYLLRLFSEKQSVSKRFVIAR